MKILTQSEYDALSDGPHDAREVGLPLEYKFVMVWANGQWWQGKMYVTISDISAWCFDGHNPIDASEYPIWHKLPADYVEPE